MPRPSFEIHDRMQGPVPSGAPSIPVINPPVVPEPAPAAAPSAPEPPSTAEETPEAKRKPR